MKVLSTTLDGSALYDKFDIHAGGECRRMRLANECLRRGAVSLAEVRARFGSGTG